MDCYELRWKESAKNELKNLGKPMIKRLLESVTQLASRSV